MPRFLTVPQFAAQLGVSVACVRKWILERKVNYVKIGHLVKFEPSEVTRLISSGRHFAIEDPKPNGEKE